MKPVIFPLALMIAAGTACTSMPVDGPVPLAALPNCFDANYDAGRRLFTLKNIAGNPVNQQCLLTVGPGSGLAAGTYTVYLSNGGGGGAGGTSLAVSEGGGGGGGGAGAMEVRTVVNLLEGTYRLTIGAGGPGGSACVSPPRAADGGPGWLGSPSSIVRLATGEVVAGIADADRYSRPTRDAIEQRGATKDGHGGFGPGQSRGGSAGAAGENSPTSAYAMAGGAAGVVPEDRGRPDGGGGGGATRFGEGGDGGGGDRASRTNLEPERGTLGSGGGGGKGSASECGPGAAGGPGYIAFRPL